MVVYFSGTGNSKYCAERLAGLTEDRVINSAEFIKNGIAAELISDKPWIFVCPVYAWQMPGVFADFIRSGSFDGRNDAYFVLTCGGESGSAAEYIKTLCAEKGMNFRGAADVVMPDNYIVMFKAPTAEESKGIIAEADKALEKIALSIRKGEALPEKKTGLLDKIKSGFVNKGFSQLYIKADKFRVTDKCVSCGKCVDLCPLGNIRMADGRPAWGAKCTQCMACISYCSTEAIEYGKGTIGKTRYRFPE